MKNIRKVPCNISAPIDLVTQIDAEIPSDQNRSQLYVKLLRYGHIVHEKIVNEKQTEDDAIKQTVDEELTLLQKYKDIRKGTGDVNDLYRSFENYLSQNYSRDSVKRLAEMIKVIADIGKFSLEYDISAREQPFILQKQQ